MEGDSVRISGDSTLVDVWVDGKMRSVSVSRRAIAALLQLPPDRATTLTEEERRDCVRTRLSLVVRAAQERLRELDPGTDQVTVDSIPADPPVGEAIQDRRQGDRRKGERRKLNLGPPLSGERRKGGPRRG